MHVRVPRYFFFLLSLAFKLVSNDTLINIEKIIEILKNSAIKERTIKFEKIGSHRETFSTCRMYTVRHFDSAIIKAEANHLMILFTFNVRVLRNSRDYSSNGIELRSRIYDLLGELRPVSEIFLQPSDVDELIPLSRSTA